MKCYNIWKMPTENEKIIRYRCTLKIFSILYICISLFLVFHLPEFISGDRHDFTPTVTLDLVRSQVMIAAIIRTTFPPDAELNSA